MAVTPPKYRKPRKSSHDRKGRIYTLPVDDSDFYRRTIHITAVVLINKDTAIYCVAQLTEYNGVEYGWWVIPTNQDQDFREEPIGPFPTALRAARVLFVVEALSGSNAP